MAANDRQVGGAHYRAVLQHWDLSILYRWDPFQYQITKYVMRYKGKNGLQDLEKAQHFLEKYIENVKEGRVDMTPPDPLPQEEWLRMMGMSTDAEPCCDEPENCGRPCTWRGRQLALAEHPYANVPEGAINPTGWKGFTFEGTKEEMDWYRCVECREHLKVPMNAAPCLAHHCGTEPGRRYVDQD